jgi:hypothetical protein
VADPGAGGAGAAGIAAAVSGARAAPTGGKVEGAAGGR